MCFSGYYDVIIDSLYLVFLVSVMINFILFSVIWLKKKILIILFLYFLIISGNFHILNYRVKLDLSKNNELII